MPKIPTRNNNGNTNKTKLASNEVPDHIQAYVFHGLDLNKDGGEWIGGCPFCGRDDKFTVSEESGQWRCLVCGGGLDRGGGSVFEFLRLLWEVSDKATTAAEYSKLALDRTLEYSETLVSWGVSKSILTGNWMIPAWGIDPSGKLRFQQLYVYLKRDNRMVLIPTPKGLKSALFGLTHYDIAKPEVVLCEGPWDAMRLWEVLRTTKQSDGKFSATSSEASCLLASINVLAVPGCNTFADGWVKWFKGKTVALMYDSDYPKTNPKTGTPAEAAGYTGLKRVAGILGSVAAELSYLKWGDEGYDSNLPDGYDVRDLLKKDKLVSIGTLFNKVEPVPDSWVSQSVAARSASIKIQNCTSWNLLINSWRKAMKWTPGLDHALATMLACVASTKSAGSQLWIKIIGPASCGKSTLCEALSVNKAYVVAKSTFRGFHSGFKTRGGESDEDNSLIPLINNRTFIVKDGDTLLQAPNLSQILSEGRDIYDRVSRTHYRNQMGKDYEGISMTWILCGTSSLRSIDSSELGERFLDCVIMERIDEELEDEILLRVAHKAAAHVDMVADEGDENATQLSPELIEAMELTGGYINYLREHASKVLPKIAFPDEAKRACINIGKFVAYMRARPSDKQKEQAERELGARLVEQHVRLAKCLALVLNRQSVDEQVIARTMQVGLDTSRGIVLDITKQLYITGDRGAEHKHLMLHVNCSDGELRSLLRFLREINVVEQFNTSSRKAWRLTHSVSALFTKVMPVEVEEPITEDVEEVESE